MNYLALCLNCGINLSIHAGEPQSCPWVCFVCHRGFWVSELQARKYYRPVHFDFGHGLHLGELEKSKKLERDQALIRGASTLPEQIPMLVLSDLEFLLKRKLDPGFAQSIQDQITVLKTPNPQPVIPKVP